MPSSVSSAVLGDLRYSPVVKTDIVEWIEESRGFEVEALAPRRSGEGHRRSQVKSGLCLSFACVTFR